MVSSGQTSGGVAKSPFHPYRVSRSRLSSRNFTCLGIIEASTRKLDCCASILGNPFFPCVSGDAMVSMRSKVSKGGLYFFSVKGAPGGWEPAERRVGF